MSLNVVGIHKRYKTREVVKDISLLVSPGQVVGLLGPNGAGKTTCFYMVVGLIPCDTGHIYLDGKEITKLPIHARARMGIGYLPQEASVFRKLTVSQNILAILEMQPNFSESQQLEKLEFLLHEFHLGHLRDHMGTSLSGGERRRLEIARALATEPRVILLDEPFAGIDPISIIDIKRIIQHLIAKNIGVFITDHNVRETLDICEYAYIINEGQLLAEGTSQAILENHQVRQVYLGQHFRI